MRSGDAGHEAACHWLDRADAERAAHPPPEPGARTTIEREASDD